MTPWAQDHDNCVRVFGVVTGLPPRAQEVALQRRFVQYSLTRLHFTRSFSGGLSCGTEFCYVCGRASGTEPGQCARKIYGHEGGCDARNMFMESQEGWGRFARGDESEGEGALHECCAGCWPCVGIVFLHARPVAMLF